MNLRKFLSLRCFGTATLDGAQRAEFRNGLFAVEFVFTEFFLGLNVDVARSAGVAHQTVSILGVAVHMKEYLVALNILLRTQLACVECSLLGRDLKT
jgi:hypothetical protein